MTAVGLYLALIALCLILCVKIISENGGLHAFHKGMLESFRLNGMRQVGKLRTSEEVQGGYKISRDAKRLRVAVISLSVIQLCSHFFGHQPIIPIALAALFGVIPFVGSREKYYRVALDHKNSAILISIAVMSLTSIIGLSLYYYYEYIAFVILSDVGIISSSCNLVIFFQKYTARG